MSQSSPYEELKEIIIQYVSLDVHDTLKEPELSAQALVENAFLLMDDQLPSDITGLSVYHRENLLYAAAMGGQVYDQDNKHATLSQGLHPAVRVEVVKLIDRELKELSPGSALSAGTLEEKVGFECWWCVSLLIMISGQSTCSSQSKKSIPTSGAIEQPSTTWRY